MAIRIQNRRGTAAQWTTANPILAAGEPGLETDTRRFKVGDGAAAWASLPYFAGTLGRTVDAQFPREDGFATQAVNRAYSFLCFGSAGQVIGSSHRSSGGKTVAVSTDDMATWTLKTAPDATYAPEVGFTTAAGTLLVSAKDKLYRSTDLGATWALVLTVGAGANPGSILGQGITEAAAGTIWVAEYRGTGKVWRSTDDGGTFTVMADFVTSDEGAGSPIVRHIHGIASLPSGIWLYVGDNNSECGLWKWDGAAFQRMSPTLTDANGAQRYRAVGLAERGGRLYWIQDGASLAAPGQPVIVSAPVTDLAALTVHAELPTGGWYIAALTDGTLVVGGVTEPTGREEDDRLRLWAIDAADNIHELWSVRAHPSATGNKNIGNLRVRASDNMIGFTAQKSEMGDNSNDAHVAVLGQYRAGGKAKAAYKPTARQPLFGVAGRVWNAVATTSAPTTTALAAAPDTLAEMTLTIDASGAPILLQFEGCTANSGSGNVTSFGFSFNGIPFTGALPADIDIRDVHSPGASFITSVSLTKLWTPAPGLYTVTVKWWVSAGTATGRFTRRNLTGYELAAANQ